ncbi:MAG: hypothetical protein K2H76_00800 [Muribaculaceae bacterium]|nr:hypothetical protein [Muribaculaceae bacterium]
MDDDKLKNMFREFNPDLSSDFRFISQLKRSMDSVEIVREHTMEIKRRSRIAVIIAAAVGFICGILFSLFLPAIGEAMKGLELSSTPGSLLNSVAQNYFPIALTVIAGAMVFISMNAYELSLFILKRRS